MRHLRIGLFAAGIGLLAMVPFAAMARDNGSSQLAGASSEAFSVAGDHAPRAGSGIDERGSGQHRGWLRFQAQLHDLICDILATHAPRAYDVVCADAGDSDATPTPTPEDTPTPAPEPTATPTPEPTPSGMANFLGDAMMVHFASVSPGTEWGIQIVPFDTSPGGGEYAWPDGTYRVSLSRSSSGSTILSWSGPGPGVFGMKTVAATCGAWDTMQIAILDGSNGVSGTLQNVVLDGASLGTLADNGDAFPDNDYWTFNGSFAGGFSMTFDLVVSGWGATLATPARIEITTGCGA